MSQLVVGTWIATYRRHNFVNCYLNYFFYIKIIRHYIKISSACGETSIPKYHAGAYYVKTKNEQAGIAVVL